MEENWRKGFFFIRKDFSKNSNLKKSSFFLEDISVKNQTIKQWSFLQEFKFENKEFKKRVINSYKIFFGK